MILFLTHYLEKVKDTSTCLNKTRRPLHSPGHNSQKKMKRGIRLRLSRHALGIGICKMNTILIWVHHKEGAEVRRKLLSPLVNILKRGKTEPISYLLELQLSTKIQFAKVHVSVRAICASLKQQASRRRS